MQQPNTSGWKDSDHHGSKHWYWERDCKRFGVERYDILSTHLIFHLGPIIVLKGFTTFHFAIEKGKFLLSLKITNKPTNQHTTRQTNKQAKQTNKTKKTKTKIKNQKKKQKNKQQKKATPQKQNKTKKHAIDWCIDVSVTCKLPISHLEMNYWATVHSYL